MIRKVLLILSEKSKMTFKVIYEHTKLTDEMIQMISKFNYILMLFFEINRIFFNKKYNFKTNFC